MYADALFLIAASLDFPQHTFMIGMILHVPALDDSVDDELTLGMGTELELLEAAGEAAVAAVAVALASSITASLVIEL